MYQCTSGKHWWTDKADADRCCDPAWTSGRIRAESYSLMCPTPSNIRKSGTKKATISPSYVLWKP
jgi:hypothetical protein